MKLSWINATLITAVLLLGLAIQSNAAALEAKKAPAQLIVKFKPGTSDKVIAAINRGHGASVLRTSKRGGFKVLKIPFGKSEVDMARVYAKNPNVEYAEPNFIATAHEIPNDPYYSYQWHLDDDNTAPNPYGGANGGGINVEGAWDITDGTGIIVAVVDTGVAYEDFEDRIWLNSRKYRTVSYAMAPDLASTTFVQGYDFVNDDYHPNDDEGHGTHVAGTIAQSTNNSDGVAGVAYGAAIMPVKVLDGNGSGTYADIADGIYFAADNGADVINMSLGGSSGSITLEDALAYAHGEKGVTIVCSSGNDGMTDAVGYPAAYDAYCIAVGATRYDETVSYYTNQGSSLDICAPGGDTSVDQNGDGYVDGVLQQTHDGSDFTAFGYYFYQGTSMAAPHVSGVAALVIASGAGFTPAEVREALQATAEDKGEPGWDTAYGHGIVDALAAVNYSPSPNTLPVADAGGPYTVDEDVPLIFDGSGSYDADNDSITYSWDFGDGATGSGVEPSHTYAAGGKYTVTLIVNDGRVNSSADTTTVDVNEVNDAPVADAGGPYTVDMDVPLIFDGSGSYDIDNDIVAYDWDFGDAKGSGMKPSHTYAASGTYTVTLTVTDENGLTDTATATVTVNEDEEIAQSMVVSSISVVLQKNRNKYQAMATVKVVDTNDSPINGAIVSGTFDLSGEILNSTSDITDAEGTAYLFSDNKPAKSGKVFTFTLIDVINENYLFDKSESVTSGYETVP